MERELTRVEHARIRAISRASRQRSLTDQETTEHHLLMGRWLAAKRAVEQLARANQSA